MLLPSGLGQTFIKQYPSSYIGEMISTDINRYAIAAYGYDSTETTIYPEIIIVDSSGNTIHTWSDSLSPIPGPGIAAIPHIQHIAGNDYVIAGTIGTLGFVQKVNILSGQTSFRVLDSSYLYNIINGVEVLANQNIVVIGNGIEAGTSNTYYFVRCYDSTGNQLWSYPNGPPPYLKSEPYGVVSLDSFIYVGLNANIQSSSSQRFFHLMTFLDNGQLLNDTLIDFSTQGFIVRDLATQGDSSVLILGYSEQNPWSNISARLFKYHLNGFIEWDYHYPVSGESVFGAKISTPDDDGNLALVANESGYQNVPDFHLHYVNSSGIQQWKREYDFGGDENGQGAALLPNGKILVSGRNRPTTSTGMYSGFLSKFYADGSLDYSTISGDVFHDDNEDGIFDSTEAALSGFVLRQLPDQQYAYSDANGAYNLDVFSSGTYQVEIPYLPTYWTYTQPSSGDTSLSIVIPQGTSGVVGGVDFGLKQLEGIYDLSTFAYHTVARPGFTSSMYLYARNVGIEPLSNVVITYRADSIGTIYSIQDSSFSYVQDSLQWIIPSLGVNQIWSCLIEYQIPVNVALIGDSIHYHIEGSHSQTDTTPDNNQYSSYRIITGSYDPNDKQVSPTGAGNIGLISSETPYLDYRIRFQNTGTDTAFTVVITDTLDNNVLYIPSIRDQLSSHPYTFDLSGEGIAKWTFSNILLPDSGANEAQSHGFVQFRIDLVPGLSVGTEIENYANIYFDFNPAIVTNTTLNTLFQCDTTVSMLTLDMCEGDSIWLGGAYQTSAGIYSNVFQTSQGCDSVVMTDLQVSSTNVQITQSSDSLLVDAGYDSYQWIDCQSMQAIPGASNPYFIPDVSGEYFVEITSDSCQSQSACQFICITQELASIENICQGDSIWLGGAYQTNAGIYSDVFQTSQGCDSIVNTDLQVLDVQAAIMQVGDSLIAPSGYDQYQWYDCEEMEILNGETNAIFIPDSSGSFFVEIGSEDCMQQSDCQSISIVGILEALDKHLITIRPNPIESELWINLGSVRTSVEIRLWGIDGKLILDKQFSSAEEIKLNLHDLISGIYLLQVYTDTHLTHFRMLKN